MPVLLPVPSSFDCSGLTLIVFFDIKYCESFNLFLKISEAIQGLFGSVLFFISDILFFIYDFLNSFHVLFQYLLFPCSVLIEFFHSSCKSLSILIDIVLKFLLGRLFASILFIPLSQYFSAVLSFGSC